MRAEPLNSSTNEVLTSRIYVLTFFLGVASFYMTPTCDGATATITGDNGGFFNLNPNPPDGAAIDPTTGTVTGCISGETYYVEYTTLGACADSSIENFTSGCYGRINVNAFIDENSNAVLDASENYFNQGVFTYEVSNYGVVHHVNSMYGYEIQVFEAGNTYDIGFTLYANYNNCLNQTINIIEDVTVTEGETVEVNFPLELISDCNDIGLYLFANVPLRSGVTNINTLVVSNLGSTTVSGSVEFTHDPDLALLDVLFVDTGNTITNTATGFILNFNNLQPFENETVRLYLDVPTDAVLDDTMTNSAIYNVDDLILENNVSTLTQTVVNSYDPNDKMESHGPEIKFDDFTEDDYLFYTIRFQNLGTAEAIDIRVEDVLDAQLDISSFKMLHASHDYVLTRVDGNLNWEFEDINLPSESMDEPNSHGYIYFKIKPNSGFQIGDVIPNYADIYFDFNPAVTTNTFETEFVANLSVEGFNLTQFSMYSNPAKQLVNIQFNTNVGNNINVHIFDLQGKLVMKANTVSESNTIQFNVSNLSKGMYFVELIGNDFKIVEKLIIQ